MEPRTSPSQESIKAKISEFVLRSPNAEFTFEDLHRPVNSVDVFDVANAVISSTHDGLLEQFVRVFVQGKAHDFQDIPHIPDRIDGVAITPGDLKIMYRRLNSNVISVPKETES